MSNAGNNGTRKKNNNAASVATSATAKKARTAKQQAANAASKQKAQNAQAWLESHGLKKGVVYAAKYRQMQKQGKSDDEIIEAIRALQVSNNAARATAKTAKKPAGTGNNAKSVVSNATAASKRNVATQRQRNLAKKFKNAGVKWAARAYHTQKLKEGKTNEQALDEIKAEHPEFLLNAPPIPRAKKAASAAPSTAVVVAAANTGAVKGQYICEKCRLVANAPAPSAPAANAGNAGNAPAANAAAGNATPPPFEEVTE